MNNPFRSMRFWVIAAAAASAGFVIISNQATIEDQERIILGLHKDLGQLESERNQLTAALNEQQATMARMQKEIARRDDIADQARAETERLNLLNAYQMEQLTKLKANDKATADWAAKPVPGAVRRLLKQARANTQNHHSDPDEADISPGQPDEQLPYTGR